MKSPLSQGNDPLARHPALRFALGVCVLLVLSAGGVRAAAGQSWDVSVFGVLVPVSKGRSVSFEIDYLHISNGDIVPRNPGVDMLQVTIGYHFGF